MKVKYIQSAAFPAMIILVSVAVLFVMSAFSANSEVPTLKVKVDHITTLPIEQTNHTVNFKMYGELQPIEITNLSTRVSGNVEYWSEKLSKGTVVKKGEILYKIEDSQYQAELKNAEAELLNVKAKLEQELGMGKVAQIELDRMNSDQENRLFLRKPQIKSAYAAVRSAEAKVSSAKKKLEYTVGVAPFDALVVEKSIGTGQFVNQGANIAVLYNIGGAKVELPVARFDNQYLPSNLKGTEVVIRLPDSDYEGAGKLIRRVQLVDRQTRAYKVVARVTGLLDANSGNSFLQFGDFVEVEFSGRTLEKIYKVPEELIENGRVWVVNGGQLAQRKVAVLRNENGFAIINSGIHSSDKIVDTLPEYPYKGMPVKVVSSNLARL
ncbi:MULTISPECIES: efflux RND transporter periplasmic adaptor subunit [unclassified Pseudoalteromonas]|uniref:efflux RND transporter periplasmic adaptor subunit n=1 Tax=unclassified Pseudoalteromonas TaxID=194690 RepID=UPI0030142C91